MVDWWVYSSTGKVYSSTAHIKKRGIKLYIADVMQTLKYFITLIKQWKVTYNCFYPIHKTDIDLGTTNSTVP